MLRRMSALCCKAPAKAPIAWGRRQLLRCFRKIVCIEHSAVHDLPSQGASLLLLVPLGRGYALHPIHERNGCREHLASHHKLCSGLHRSELSGVHPLPLVEICPILPWRGPPRPVNRGERILLLFVVAGVRRPPHRRRRWNCDALAFQCRDIQRDGAAEEVVAQYEEGCLAKPWLPCTTP